MAPKLRRSPPPLRRRNYATDYDASLSQSLDASNEDDYDASESNNFQTSGHKSKSLEINEESATNSPTNLQSPNAAATVFPYINIAPLPVFHGGSDECPATHLSRFAKVCRANNAASVEIMMRIFPVTLQGEALLWYDLNIEPYPPISWEELKSSFLDAYNKIELAEQLRSELMTISQRPEENVRSYFLRLQLILKKWPPGNELSDGFLKAIFMDGLREEFKEWMIPQKPDSLNEALRLAFGLEQVTVIRTSGGKRFLRCGFCEGRHEELVCEVRERMRRLWKSREKKNGGDMAESEGHNTAELVRSVSAISRNEAEVGKDGGEMVGLKKKGQCQCWKHQCGMKKLDRNLSMLSKTSKP
ncbi:hypothetical protein SDJN03_02086, partial [Cucurbita argyrosperma subsp. sororia]